MGRTILSYRMALEMEKEDWKPFRNAPFDKSDRKDFDKMFVLGNDTNTAYVVANINRNTTELEPRPPVVQQIFDSFALLVVE